MAENFLKILNPITPFITEELWEKLGHNNTISYEKWPTYDISKTKEEQIEIGIQVNGKLRGSILSNLNETKDDLLEKAMKEDNVKKYVEGKTVVKTIVIPGKIVNIVIK
jgi:leucyl-tRNA synthetase